MERDYQTFAAQYIREQILKLPPLLVQQAEEEK